MISVLILTKNEEANISDCIDSCRWSNDIIVFDSVSTDRTCEIARSKGAAVYQRAFDNYGAQREAARKVPYMNPWVLALDADERPDGELVHEIQTIASQEICDHAAYRMRRKDHFMGKWIKHSSLYPSWFIRFYKHASIYYEPREVHEYPTVNGSIGVLKGHLLHYSFNKGLTDWFEKHVRYAAREAIEDLKSKGDANQSMPVSGLFSADPVTRRRTLKNLSYRLPCRPTLRFLYVWILKQGFRDGRPGYNYARMMALYEEMIVINKRYRQSSGKH